MTRRPITDTDRALAAHFRAELDRRVDLLIGSGLDSALVAAELLGASARIAVRHSGAGSEEARAMFVRGALMQINKAIEEKERGPS